MIRDDAAVLLIDPKFPHNVGGALRACACLGAGTLRWTGSRVNSPRQENEVAKVSTRFPREARKRRFPREERMKAYNSVLWEHERSGRPVTDMARELGLVPVAVEIADSFEELPEFEHPERALYIFGPEDGSLGRATLMACHRFVRVPSVGCMNLAATVNVLLYDRLAKSTSALKQEEEMAYVS